MKIYYKSILVIAFLTCNVLVYGQLNFKTGYIISLNNDTIYGKINDAGQIKNSKLCSFKANNGKKVIRYSPEEIKAYKLIGDKYFYSKKVSHNGKIYSTFLEVLIDSQVKLYYNWKSSDLAYFIEKQDNSMSPLINADVNVTRKSDYWLVYSHYDNMKIPLYKDTLVSFFSDSKKTQNLIYNIEYKHESLMSLVTEYSKEKCEKSECVNYSKDLTIYRTRFGIYSGINLNNIQFLYYKSDYNSELEKVDIQSISLNTSPINIFFNIPLPNFSDRLSFQIELTTSKLNLSEEFNSNSNFFNSIVLNHYIIGVPLLLKYEIRGKLLSPSIAFGKSTNFGVNSSVNVGSNEIVTLHQTQKGGWLGEIGIDFKLSPKLSIFSSIRMQSIKSIVVSEFDKRINYKRIEEESLYRIKYITNTTAINFGIKF